jgi:hypothetical protein
VGVDEHLLPPRIEPGAMQTVGADNTAGLCGFGAIRMPNLNRDVTIPGSRENCGYLDRLPLGRWRNERFEFNAIPDLTASVICLSRLRRSIMARLNVSSVGDQDPARILTASAGRI